MDEEQRNAEVQLLANRFIARVMEHASSVQIVITLVDDADQTTTLFHVGSGDFYARMGAVRSFLDREQAVIDREAREDGC